MELIFSKVAMQIKENKVMHGVKLSHNKVDMEDNNREVMVPKVNLSRELQELIKESLKVVTSGGNLNKVLMEVSRLGFKEVRLANRPIIKQGQAKVVINGVNHKEVLTLNGVSNLVLRVVKTLKVMPE